MKQPWKEVQCLHFLLPSNALHPLCTYYFYLIKLSEEKVSHPCVPERVFCKKPVVALLKSLDFGHCCCGSSWLPLNLFHCTFSSSKSHCKIQNIFFINIIFEKGQEFQCPIAIKRQFNIFRCFNKYVFLCWSLFKNIYFGLQFVKNSAKNWYYLKLDHKPKRKFLYLLTLKPSSSQLQDKYSRSLKTKFKHFPKQQR